MAESDPLGNAWRYEYAPAGNRIREVDANGHVTVYTYNDADDLLVRVAYDGGAFVEYAYDENHNRTVMTDTLGVSRWAYAPLNRVVEATDSLGRTLRCAYDANGNRVQVEWNGPPGTPVQGMDYAYAPEDRLIVAQAYQGNGRGRRVEREVTRLYYDGLGRWLAKEYDPKDSGGVKRTEYVLDGLDPVGEYAVWNGQWEEYYRGGVEAFSPVPVLLAMQCFPAGTEGQMCWYHLDGRGSIAGLTKHLGRKGKRPLASTLRRLWPPHPRPRQLHRPAPPLHVPGQGVERTPEAVVRAGDHLPFQRAALRPLGVWLTREPLRGVFLQEYTPSMLHSLSFWRQAHKS